MEMTSQSHSAALVEASALATVESTAACLFHRFSDPARLAILRHLSLGEHRVVELTEHLGLAQPTFSKHLACLRDCGPGHLKAAGQGFSVQSDPP